MSVDEGIDIVASKDNKYFHIQVKTSTADDSGSFKFTIKKQSLKNNSSTNTFYVFVTRTDKSLNQFFIIPDNFINHQHDLGVINGQDFLSISISYDASNKKYRLNRKIDATIYLNNFSQIR